MSEKSVNCKMYGSVNHGTLVDHICSGKDWIMLCWSHKLQRTVMESLKPEFRETAKILREKLAVQKEGKWELLKLNHVNMPTSGRCSPA